MEHLLSSESMPALSIREITQLLEPYISPLPYGLAEKLSIYLDLLLKWNARTNLTAVRDPEEIVRRHFGESLFAGLHLPAARTLLDFGSGAGFPGLPIQLLRPDITVTLAESQNKKSSFLREAVRALELQTEVWAGRVEAMPSPRHFDIVTLRAVDDMDVSLATAAPRALRSIVLLTTRAKELPGFTVRSLALPGSEDGKLVIATRR